MKFKGLKKDYQVKQEQSQLKEAYGITEESVKIVERKTAIVPVLRLTGKSVAITIRVIATIIILALAFIGLTALIYPAPRQALYDLLQLVLNEISGFMN